MSECRCDRHRRRRNLSCLVAIAAGVFLGGPAMAFPAQTDDGSALPYADTDARHAAVAGAHLVFVAPATNDLDLAASAKVTTPGSPADAGLLPGLPEGFVATVSNAVSTPRAATTSLAPTETRSGDSDSTGGHAQTAARSERPRPQPPGAGMLLPFGPEVGAAMLRHGDLFLVYLDTAAELALPPDHGLFVSATVERSANAMLLRLMMASGSDLRLCRVETGWLLSRATSAPCDAPPTITLDRADGALRLHAGHPGRVVAARDPITGQDLLIETAGDERFGRVADPSRSPAAMVPGTELGIILAEAGDAVRLDRQADGAIVRPWGGDATGLLPADAMTHVLDLPHMDALQARQRLEQAQTLLRQHAAPSRAMLIEAAEAALGAGNGWQALYFVHQAQAWQTPGDSNEQRRIAMIDEAAQLLEHFPLETTRASTEAANSAFADRSDEAASWRALAGWQRDPPAGERCSRLQQAVQLLSDYPAPLRERLLPAAGEALSACGTGQELSWLQHLPDDDTLRLAKAQAQARGNDLAGPLDGLDRLTRDRDPVVAYRAEKLDIDYRVRRHEMDARQAADRLEPLVFAARMAGDEDAWARDLAELRLQAGQFDQALDALSLLPASAGGTNELLLHLVQALATGDEPKDLVAWDSQLLKCAKLLERQGSSDPRTRVMLAEALLRGGLARKAIEVLPSSDATTDVDLRLRILTTRVKGLVDLGDIEGARAALSAAQDAQSNLPNPIIVLQAQIAMRAGDCAGALQSLDRMTQSASGDHDREISRLRALCQTKTARWSEAETSWQGLLPNAAPRDALPAADQEIVLRYLEAATRAGDTAAVELGIRQFSDRMTSENRIALSALQKTVVAVR